MTIYEGEGNRDRNKYKGPEEVAPTWDSGDVFKVRPALRDQLHYQATSLLREARRTAEERETILKGIGSYCETRYQRGLDLQSPEVEVARANHRAYYNEPAEEETDIKLKLCMDSRTRKTTQLGIPGGAAVSLRSPGGRDEGFTVQGIGNGLYLEPDSYFADGVEQTMRAGGHQLVLVDSHYHCKKAEDFEIAVEGRVPENNGVVEDRKYKAEMIAALRKFQGARKLGNRLTVVQYSYNPETGFMDFYDSNDVSRVVVRTDDIASRLDNTFKDVNRDVANADDISSSPKVVGFDLDWMNGYRGSAKKFGISLNMMRREVLPVVREIMNDANPGLKDRDPLEFEYKCRIALANSYNGWLLNRNGTFPHSKHKEDIVVGVMGGEHGPFSEAESFEIPRGGLHFRENAAYAANLVRRFRQIGKDSDPIPLVMGHRVDTKDPASLELIADLTSQIADDLPNIDWVSMSYVDLTKYVIRRFGGDGKKRNIPAEFTDALAEMVDGYKRIYDPRAQDELRSGIYKGNIIPFGIFVDANRAPVASLPLLPQRKAA